MRSTHQRDFPDERDLPVRDLAWARIGQAPNDRVQRKTAKLMRRRADRPTGAPTACAGSILGPISAIPQS